MRRSITGIALGLILSAPPLAIAAGPFDGVYTGQQKTTINGNFGFCQNLDHAVRLPIVNNTIVYPWGRGTLQATINTDGSFFVDQPAQQMVRGVTSFHLKGRFNQGTLEADVGGAACEVHLSLKKM